MFYEINFHYFLKTFYKIDYMNTSNFCHFITNINKFILPVHTIKNGLRHIPYVQETDAGIYTCTAQNVAGFDSRTFNLSVFGKSLYCLFI